MKKILIVFVVTFALCGLIRSDSESLSFELEAGLEFCINDIMGYNTLVVGSFSTLAEDPHFEITVNEVNVNYEGKVGDRTKGKEIFSHKVYNSKENHTNSGNPNISEIYSEHKELDNIIRFSFTTYDNAEFNFCVFNRDEVKHRFRFEYRIGPQAKDYSQLLQSSDMKDVDKLVEQITEMSKMVSSEIANNIKYEDEKIFISDHLSWKIVFASVLTIILIIILGIFQSYFLKSFLQEKKLI